MLVHIPSEGNVIECTYVFNIKKFVIRKGTFLMGKDFTTYNFNGKIYTKGRLVLAIVGKYVALHPQTTFEELKTIFPDKLQSKTSIQFSKIQVVFEKIDVIEMSEQKRFFMHDNKLIDLTDSAIAVSKEWNKENIRNFNSKAKRIGFEILEISA